MGFRLSQINQGFVAAKLRAHGRRMARFGCVGALVFSLDFGLVYSLGKMLAPSAAVTIAFFTAVSAHFCLNKWWVFGASKKPSRREIMAYAVNVLLCWCCTLFFVRTSLRLVSPNLLLAKAIAVGPTMALGFVVMRLFVFPPATSSSGDPTATP